MSQEQSKRPEGDEQKEAIKYGDVFPVFGDLASKPIAPQDAAMMQTAETTVLGKTQKGGPAAVMQSAATLNESAGIVGHNEVSDIAGNQGVTVTETHMPGTRIITESIAGQVVGEFSAPAPIPASSPASVFTRDAITIGEALEATAIAASNKPVDESDAAAIQAAEMRATGSSNIAVGGVAAAAQSAASMNARLTKDEVKTKLGELLTNASEKLPADKAVTREDAEGVIGAELRNNPNMSTHPGGVAESMAAAANMNQQGLLNT
ncbi:Late embryogenesis abundant protein [Thalictrum thalictroides]|uniref:Late embryogenesis abundant protein n=1 Tax=Thalictrum thalictroides TaxID=46969 RepID=A0A7J6VW71_THATH|nr:Late embryogenesis abundant protein [Thalictrum thalictroides]